MVYYVIPTFLKYNGKIGFFVQSILFDVFANVFIFYNMN
jgi:hypothetical protein